MAIVEDSVEDDELRDAAAGPPVDKLEDLVAVIARLELPQSLLRVDKENPRREPLLVGSYLAPQLSLAPKANQQLDDYRFHTLQVIQDLRTRLDGATAVLSALDDKGVADLVYRLIRLDGEDEWCSEMVRGWLRGVCAAHTDAIELKPLRRVRRPFHCSRHHPSPPSPAPHQAALFGPHAPGHQPRDGAQAASPYRRRGGAD